MGGCMVAVSTRSHPEARLSAGQPAVVAGRYRLERCLGSGGMGEVWRAQHLFTRRAVALKRVHPCLLHKDAEAARRFFDEAALQASVRHPGVVEVFDAGREPDGTAYMAMELLSGWDLETALLQRRLRPRDVVRVATRLLDALAACHAQGVLHLDVKPGNVFLVRSEVRAVQVKLLDFGVAQRVSDGRCPNFGTLEFMSPEQARREPVGPRSDLFSVAAVLYRGLTGRPPYRCGRPETLAAASMFPPPGLRDVRPELPEDLAEVVDRGLASVGRRWGRAEDMAQALMMCDHRQLAELSPPQAEPCGSERTVRFGTGSAGATLRVPRARRNPSLLPRLASPRVL